MPSQPSTLILDIAAKFGLKDVGRDYFMLLAGMTLILHDKDKLHLLEITTKKVLSQLAPPEAANITQALLEISARIKDVTVAHYFSDSGRGVVYTKTGSYLIEVDKMNRPQDAAGALIGMWMSGGSDLIEMFADEYPFPEVYAQLQQDHLNYLQSQKTSG